MKFWLAVIFCGLPAAALAQEAAQEYVHGDECLFCHRNTIGVTWQKNRHGVTLRQIEDVPGLSVPSGTTHVLGSRSHIRYLKKSGYGMLDIHSNSRASREWIPGKFADRCAGCHATAVDPKTKAYNEIGIDCYACHGIVDLDHANDTSKIFLSKKQRGDRIAITNACAQCHLRQNAKSRSTGLPYPAGYVAPRDLFADYVVNWAAADDPAMNPGDRHVWKNVRDVVQNGAETTCLSCHRIHENSSERHRRVLTGPICLECHSATGPKSVVRKYEMHSALCEY